MRTREERAVVSVSRSARLRAHPPTVTSRQRDQPGTRAVEEKPTRGLPPPDGEPRRGRPGSVTDRPGYRLAIHRTASCLVTVADASAGQRREHGAGSAETVGWRGTLSARSRRPNGRVYTRRRPVGWAAPSQRWPRRSSIAGRSSGTRRSAQGRSTRCARTSDSEASGPRRAPTVASRWTGRSPARWSGRGWCWRPCARSSRHGWSLAVAEDRPTRAADRTERRAPLARSVPALSAPWRKSSSRTAIGWLTSVIDGCWIAWDEYPVRRWEEVGKGGRLALPGPWASGYRPFPFLPARDRLLG